MALEVMVEHTGESTPSRTIVIDRTNARVLARFGDGVVKVNSRYVVMTGWQPGSTRFVRCGRLHIALDWTAQRVRAVLKYWCGVAVEVDAAVGSRRVRR